MAVSSELRDGSQHAVRRGCAEAHSVRLRECLFCILELGGEELCSSQLSPDSAHPEQLFGRSEQQSFRGVDEFCVRSPACHDLPVSFGQFSRVVPAGPDSVELVTRPGLPSGRVVVIVGGFRQQPLQRIEIPQLALGGLTPVAAPSAQSRGHIGVFRTLPRYSSGPCAPPPASSISSRIDSSRFMWPYTAVFLCSWTVSEPTM